MKIKVDMTPNPLDLQTLHCSQGDTEERKFQFALHRNGEIIDTSDISDPVFTSFPVYVGGTEELQPVNEASPSTSPIVADITYPDGVREGEEFTYRESPTTISGNAKVSLIKGNTLVWNQLVQNGNFADGVNNWVGSGTTISASNGVLSVVPTGTSGTRFVYQNTNLLNGHKILYSLYLKLNKQSTNSRLQFYNTQTTALLRTNNFSLTANVESFVTGIITMTSDFDRFDIQPIYSGQALTTDVFTVRNCMLFDLTLMFGAGNEPSTVDEFTKLFPLPFYQFEQGKLLSFNGTGIKTTGKNRINIDDVQIGKAWNGASNSSRAVVYAPCFPNTQYTLSFGTLNIDDILLVEKNIEDATTTQRLTSVKALNPFTFITSAESHVFGFQFNKANISASDLDGLNLQIEFGSSATPYEPYTENTTNLPTLTYFPTGMKSAGSVYDELTPSKAITRVGAVDLGTLNWYYTSGGQGRFASAGISSTVKPVSANTQVSNIKCVKYSTISAGSVYNGNVGIAIDNTGAIWVHDTTYGTDASAFKTAMSDVYLYYELATPTEGTFTSATLITKNGEASLYKNGDVLECECNENISKENGYFDAKISLTDDTGTNYSNKFQIIVERSPE